MPDVLADLRSALTDATRVPWVRETFCISRMTIPPSPNTYMSFVEKASGAMWVVCENPWRPPT